MESLPVARGKYPAMDNEEDMVDDEKRTFGIG